MSRGKYMSPFAFGVIMRSSELLGMIFIPIAMYAISIRSLSLLGWSIALFFILGSNKRDFFAAAPRDELYVHMSHPARNNCLGLFSLIGEIFGLKKCRRCNGSIFSKVRPIRDDETCFDPWEFYRFWPARHCPHCGTDTATGAVEA
ncbi:hypothetical protein [Sphingopyxis sp. 22461]|uniref:hypothetical protein n=1 Tax=Sphingopyxis sp. 22461 TaxID=3453923 RepID=UPI003F851FB8